MPAEKRIAAAASLEQVPRLHVVYVFMILKRGKIQKRQELTAQIPKSRDALYKYPIDWDTCEKVFSSNLDLFNAANVEHTISGLFSVQKNIVGNIMKPWVVEKIVEYLGEEEDTLVSFILSKLNSRSEPSAILTVTSHQPVFD